MSAIELQMMIELAHLRAENQELKTLLMASNRIAASNLDKLTEERWRPYPWILDLTKEEVST